MPMKPQTYIHLILEVTSLAVGPSAPPIIPMEADSELQPNKPSAQTNEKMHATNFFTPITPFANSYLSFVLSQVSHLYYSVACNAGIGQSPYPFVGRGVTPAAFFDSRRSLRRDASIFRFAQCQVCFANIAPALRCDPIIPQIGRENNISAEICILRTVGDAGPYNEHPYEKEPKDCVFFIDQSCFLKVEM